MSTNFFEGMEELNKRTGRGNFKPILNLPVRITDVHVQNEKAATRGVDFIECALMAPAFGLEVNSMVKLRIKDRGVPADSDKTPMEIWDLQPGKKKGTGARMGVGGAIVAEDAKLLDDGTIECGWVKVVEHEFKEKPEAEWLHSGMISVNYLNVDSEKNFKFQERVVHYNDAAKLAGATVDENGNTVVLSGDDAVAAFRQTVAAFLAERKEQAGGRPAVVVRLVNQKNAGTPGSVATGTIFLGYDKDAQAYITPEATVDNWLSSPDNAKWLSFISNADKIAQAEGVLEVWPVWSFRTGVKTGQREVKNKNKGFAHTAEQFSAPMINEAGEPLFTENDKRRTHFGLITEGMHMVVMPEGFTDWIVNASWSFERYPQKLWSVDDLPTSNLAPEVVKTFEGIAVKRVAEKRNVRKASREAAPAEEQKQDQGGQDFDNAPDPNAGQTQGQGFRPRG